MTAKKLRTKCGTWRRDIRKEVKPYQFRSGGSWDKPAICRVSFRSHVAWKKRCFEFLELFLVNLIFAFSLAGAMNRPPANDNNHPYPYINIYIYVNKYIYIYTYIYIWELPVSSLLSVNIQWEPRVSSRNFVTSWLVEHWSQIGWLKNI